jgi:hypothetical protein
MKSSKPKESADSKALRARQIEDLAKLDDEENRRIKALFLRRSGSRAFRGSNTSRGPVDARGGAAPAAGGAGGAGGYSGGFFGGAGKNGLFR